MSSIVSTGGKPSKRASAASGETPFWRPRRSQFGSSAGPARASDRANTMAPGLCHPSAVPGIPARRCRPRMSMSSEPAAAVML